LRRPNIGKGGSAVPLDGCVPAFKSGEEIRGRGGRTIHPRRPVRADTPAICTKETNDRGAIP